MLTEIAIKQIKAPEKPTKIFDGGGLYLHVMPSGARYWRLKYRISAKEKLLALGSWPEVSLKQARLKRDEAKLTLAAGVDPSAVKKSAEPGNTFKAIALEWVDRKRPGWSAATYAQVMQRMETLVFPWLGDEELGGITPAKILQTLRRIEDRGATETAHRVQRYIRQIYTYAIACDRAEVNPAAGLNEAMMAVKSGHFAAITDPQEIAALMRAIDAYQGSYVVKSALCLAPLVFVRPGELRSAEWVEIDLDSALWEIPAAKMKMKEPHVVPLSTQALAILRDIHALTGRGRYVFPGHRSADRPMSEVAMLAALRRMGYEKTEMTIHGFRAMARTVLDEVLGVRVDYIEQQLAHAVKDPLGRAYNRTKHLAERRKMMQLWADWLFSVKIDHKGAFAISGQRRYVTGVEI